MKTNNLLEALKLTKKERNLFRDLKKDIRIGFEFEFKVTDVTIETIKDRVRNENRDYIEDRVREELVRGYEEEFEERIDELYNTYSAVLEDYYTVCEFAEILRFFDFNEFRDISNVFVSNKEGYLSRLNSGDENLRQDTSEEIADILFDLIDVSIKIDDYGISSIEAIDEGPFDNGFSDTYDEVYPFIEWFEDTIASDLIPGKEWDAESFSRLVELFEENDTDYLDFVEELEKLYDTWYSIPEDETNEHELEDFLRKEYQQELDERVSEYYGDPRYDKLFEEYMEEFIEDDADFDESIVDFIRDDMEEEFPLWPYIRDVTTDSSVEKGVEVITEILDYDNAEDVLNEMFDYIKDNGYTDDTTGLHINISIKGVRFSDNNFNHLKYFILSNTQYKQSTKPDQWVERNSNVKPFRSTVKLSTESLYSLCIKEHYKRTLDGQRLKGVEKVLEDSLKRYKHIELNVQNANVEEFNGNRVEIRYTGGENYEYRFNDVIQTIQEHAVLLAMAFSPTYRRKEYWKGVRKLIDFVVKESRITVFEFVRYVGMKNIDPMSERLRKDFQNRLENTTHTETYKTFEDAYQDFLKYFID